MLRLSIYLKWVRVLFTPVQLDLPRRISLHYKCRWNRFMFADRQVTLCNPARMSLSTRILLLLPTSFRLPSNFAFRFLMSCSPIELGFTFATRSCRSWVPKPGLFIRRLALSLLVAVGTHLLEPFMAFICGCFGQFVPADYSTQPIGTVVAFFVVQQGPPRTVGRWLSG